MRNNEERTTEFEAEPQNCHIFSVQESTTFLNFERFLFFLFEKGNKKFHCIVQRVLRTHT
jgi:hypothetical protein